MYEKYLVIKSLRDQSFMNFDIFDFHRRDYSESCTSREGLASPVTRNPFPLIQSVKKSSILPRYPQTIRGAISAGNKAKEFFYMYRFHKKVNGT